jgi:uncharacterized protein (TIGR03437 family)
VAVSIPPFDGLLSLGADPAPLSVATLPTIAIGGDTATVADAGLIEPGVFQLNLVIPTPRSHGDAAVLAAVGGGSERIHIGAVRVPPHRCGSNA